MKGKPQGGRENHSDADKERIVAEICNDVVEKKISFNEAIESSPIGLVSFYQWIAKSEVLQKLYNYAREVRSDVLFEEIVEIADTTEEGIKTKITAAGVEETHGDMTEHRKLRIDARKWVVAKMQPKKYGDKLDLTSGNEPLKSNITVIVDHSETAETLKRLRENGGTANQRVSENG
ncbi:MAG: hypothetical protein LLG04_14265 [Parachlamydia sp.]|nr:hypothetical protein [Parachlamydia sp.]